MSRDISKRTAVWAGLAVAVAITVTSVAGASLGNGGAEPLPVRDNVVHAVPLDSSAPAVLESNTGASVAVVVGSSTGDAVPVLTTGAPAAAVVTPPAVLAADTPAAAPVAPAPALAADVPADDPPTLSPNDPFANGPTAPPAYTAPSTQPVENPTPTPYPGS